MLIERIQKSERTFKTFNRYRENKLLKNPNAALELAVNLSDIEYYLKNATVVFELECYIDTGERFYPTTTDYEEVQDTLDTRDIEGDEIYFTLANHFDERGNRQAWGALNDSYAVHITERVEEEAENQNVTIDEIDRDEIESDHPIEEWLGSEYGDLEDVIRAFNFRDSSYGFEYWPRELYTGDTHEEERDVDTDTDEFLYEQFSFVKRKIEKIFGEECYINASTAFKIAHPTAWFVEADGSLELNDSGAGDEKTPVEIITPHWSANEALTRLEDFKVRFFERFDGTTDADSSIGCHTNLSFPADFKLDPVKLVLLSNSQQWAARFGRENHRYAAPQLKDMLRDLNAIDTRKMTLKEVRNALKSTIKLEKFRDINFLKNNVIEFRFPGNDYFDTDYEKLQETLRWLLYTMTVAGTRNLFREEYLLRLNRIKRDNDAKINKKETLKDEFTGDAFNLLNRLYSSSIERRQPIIREAFNKFLTGELKLNLSSITKAISVFEDEYGKSSTTMKPNAAQQLIDNALMAVNEKNTQLELDLFVEKKRLFRTLLVKMLTRINLN